MLKFIASAQGFSAMVYLEDDLLGHLSLFLMLFGHTCLVKCEIMSCCVNADSRLNLNASRSCFVQIEQLWPLYFIY